MEVMQRIVYLDLETTGLNVYHNNIIEIGSVLNVKKKKKWLSKSWLIKGVDIPEFIERLTGISNEETNKGGVSIKEALEDWFEFVTKGIDDINGIILMGHNIAFFDRPFILRELLDVGLIDQYDTVQGWECIDTMQISAFLFPSTSNCLAQMCSDLGIEKSSSQHRALNDAYYVKKIWREIRKRYNVKYMLKYIQSIHY